MIHTYLNYRTKPGFVIKMKNPDLFRFWNLSVALLTALKQSE